VIAELKLRAQQDPEFPSHNTFARFGGKAKLAGRLIEFCQEHEGYEDVAAICAPISLDSEPETTSNATERLEAFGSVYLLKFGRHYKIGRTNTVGRRKRELEGWEAGSHRLYSTAGHGPARASERRFIVPKVSSYIM
jgi:hypothetical protein